LKLLAAIFSVAVHISRLAAILYELEWSVLMIGSGCEPL
jgi:hypothetical protein